MAKTDETAREKKPSNDPTTREELLAKSWTTVASAYETSFVPRFAPWTNDALNALEAFHDKDERTEKKALVLCCGPGQELIPIAKILGENSTILGIDLAPGMVKLAQKRILQSPQLLNSILVEVGDANNPPPGPYRVIFSAFGLQQLSQPLDAVRKWIDSLEPKGVGVILYWPPDAPELEDSDGIFELWGELVQQKLKNDKQDSKSKQDNKDDIPIPWDHTISQVVQESNADVLQDDYLLHSMMFDNPQDLFHRMSRAGPWHAMRLRRGDNFVDELGSEFVAKVAALQPNDEEELTLQWYARMLVVRKKITQQDSEDDDKDISKL